MASTRKVGNLSSEMVNNGNAKELCSHLGLGCLFLASQPRFFNLNILMVFTNRL